MLQVDFELYFTYVERLQQIGSIRREDASRIKKSLPASKWAFVGALFTFRDDILRGLKTGRYSSSQKTAVLFKHRNSYALPNFLKVMTSEIFDSRTGDLLHNFDTSVVAELLQLLSALKKTTPKGSYAKRLSAKVWTDLVSHHEGYREHFRNLSTCFADPVDRNIWSRTSYWLNEFLSFAVPTSDPDSYPLAFGPGSNYERADATVSADWWIPYSTSRELDPDIRRFVELGISAVRRDCFGVSHDTRRGGANLIGNLHHRMRCSAQPKSYKAFRGVGVASALKMSLGLMWKNAFYDNLPSGLPLKDQGAMARLLRENFWDVGTIDLSSASDRLWWPMLLSLIPDNPHVKFLKFLRTDILELPDGKEFRSCSPLMGEAITFCLLSAFFLAVCYAVSDVVFSGEDKDKIAVYGDDIITPYYETTLAVLQRIFGAQPSWDKSYGPSSRFKESCEAHYVCNPDGKPTQVKPRYLFTSTIKEFENGKRSLRHVDCIRLLDIADAVFATSPLLSDSIADFVESNSRIRLPVTPSGVALYGRPSHGGYSVWNELTVSFSKNDEHPVSLRGLLRHKLRAIGGADLRRSDIGTLEPSDRKRRYAELSRTGARLRARSRFHSYVKNVVCAIRPSWASLEGKTFSRLCSYAYQHDPDFRERFSVLSTRILASSLLVSGAR